VNVADLQQHLNDTARMLELAGGRKGATELQAVAEALRPFRDRSLRDLASVLARAAEPPRVDDAVPKAAPARRKPAADPSAIAARLRSVYDRAADASTTRELIDAELQTLKGMKKAGLKVVAKALEIEVPGKWTAQEITKQIGLKIHTRRDVAGRSKMHGIPEPVPTPEVAPLP
jgi:hypothetical protein